MKHKILGYIFIAAVIAAAVSLLYYRDVKNLSDSGVNLPGHKDLSTSPFSKCEEKIGADYQNTVPAKIEKSSENYLLTLNCESKVSSIYIQDPSNLDQFVGSSITAKYQYVSSLNNNIECFQAPCDPVTETRLKIVSINENNIVSGTLVGQVTVGPICPVERDGVPCPVPPEAYTSRQVGVFTQNMSMIPGNKPNSKLVDSQYLDANGTYRFDLAPGTYDIWASGMRVDQLSSLKGTVTVKAGKTTTLNFDIDTGIR